MKSKKTRVFAMALAVLLVAVMLIGLLVSVFLQPAQAVAGSSSLDALRKNSKSLGEEKKKIEQELAAVRSEKASINKQKEALDKQIDITEQDIENTTALIAELSAEIDVKQTQLDEALRAQTEEYELFRTRIRAMEESGDTTYLGILLKADSFSDMLSQLDTIQEIMEYDKRLMENLEAMRVVVEETKLSLQADREEQTSVKQALADTQAELVRQSREQAQMIRQLEQEESEYKKAYEQKEAAEKELQSQIKKLMESLAKKSTQYIGGTYTWPLPGYAAGSPFGTRYHPILKVNKTHTGQDIPAPTGTKILAANGGEVLKASYNSGYGNCVVVDHGGGQATLYAHMSRFAVKVGQTVKKGQVIGYVGSTGLSTGPHLHFEIIIGGKQVNPMNYFTRAS